MKTNKKTPNPFKYFILKDGEIYSACTNAITSEQALDCCEEVGGDSILKIEHKTLKFILKQY